MSEFPNAVAAAVEGTPYKVVPTKRGFDVELDVANAQWWGLLNRAGLQHRFRWRAREHARYYASLTVTCR